MAAADRSDLPHSRTVVRQRHGRANQKYPPGGTVGGSIAEEGGSRGREIRSNTVRGPSSRTGPLIGWRSNLEKGQRIERARKREKRERERERFRERAEETQTGRRGGGWGGERERDKEKERGRKREEREIERERESKTQ